MAGDVRKPLVVMTPKSLLRHPKAVSTLDELADGLFHPVLDDPRRAVARPPRDPRERQGRVRPHRGAERRTGPTSRSCASSSTTRSRGTRSGRSSSATRRTPSSSGCRRSRATWARGASCASSSWTARSKASRPAGPSVTSEGASSRAPPPARTTRSRTSRSARRRGPARRRAGDGGRLDALAVKC